MHGGAGGRSLGLGMLGSDRFADLVVFFLNPSDRPFRYFVSLPCISSHGISWYAFRIYAFTK